MKLSIAGVECITLFPGSYCPDGAYDFGLTDFYGRPASTGGVSDPHDPMRWLCCLPMGAGLGPTAQDAISKAAENQRQAIRPTNLQSKADLP